MAGTINRLIINSGIPIFFDKTSIESTKSSPTNPMITRFTIKKIIESNVFLVIKSCKSISRNAIIKSNISLE
jgi:hypothetical protein